MTIPRTADMKDAYVASLVEVGITEKEAEVTWELWLAEERAKTLQEASEKIDLSLGHNHTRFDDMAATRAASAWLVLLAGRLRKDARKE